MEIRPSSVEEADRGYFIKLNFSLPRTFHKESSPGTWKSVDFRESSNPSFVRMNFHNTYGPGLMEVEWKLGGHTSIQVAATHFLNGSGLASVEAHGSSRITKLHRSKYQNFHGNYVP